MNHIDINLIDPNPQQPRRQFDEAALNELAESIRAHGVIQPIVVESAPNGRYILHYGERRLRASKIAGLSEIPANIHPAGTLSEKDRLITATVENVQRADMNDIELAQAYQQMHEAHGMTDDQIAAAVGKSRSAIANTRRLCRLPEDMQAAIAAGTISARIGLAYLPVLDIKPSDMDGANLSNQPSFNMWDTPTPAALRKRLVNPDKYGDKTPLTSDRVRSIVTQIQAKCQPKPCADCGQDTKKIGARYDPNDHKLYCQPCWDKQADKILYCFICQRANEFSRSQMQSFRLKCQVCDWLGRPAEWYTAETLPNMATTTSAGDAVPAAIASPDDNAGNQAAPQLAPPEPAIAAPTANFDGVDYPKYRWCINCGDYLPNGGTYSAKTNRGLCAKCYDRETAPAATATNGDSRAKLPTPGSLADYQHEASQQAIYARFRDLVQQAGPDRLAELDAWLDDLERDLLALPV